MRAVRVAIAGLLLAVCAGGQDQADWLMLKLNRFAAQYNNFVASQAAGVFDLKEARKLSALWREVEHSGEWPAVKP
jgi:hypothetical protein